MKDLKTIIESRLGNVLKNTGHKIRFKQLLEPGDIVYSDDNIYLIALDKVIVRDFGLVLDYSTKQMLKTNDIIICTNEESYTLDDWDDQNMMGRNKITRIYKMNFNKYYNDILDVYKDQDYDWGGIDNIDRLLEVMFEKDKYLDQVIDVDE